MESASLPHELPFSTRSIPSFPKFVLDLIFSKRDLENALEQVTSVHYFLFRDIAPSLLDSRVAHRVRHYDFAVSRH
jgi:hypothetical protein